MSAASDLLRAATPLLALIPAVLLATRRRVIREFERRGATHASAGLRLAPSSRLKAWWLKRLEENGVLKTSGEGLWWLDETAWRRYRAVRRRRALVVLTGLFALLATLVGLGIIGP